MPFSRALLFLATAVASLVTACEAHPDQTDNCSAGKCDLLQGRQPFAGQSIISVSDADQRASAYAFGVLGRIPGVEDALSVVTFDGPTPTVSSLPVSNSVVAWPAVVAASDRHQMAYVVETRAAPAPGVKVIFGDIYDGLPTGSLLSIVDIANPAAPRLIESFAVGQNPESVALNRDSTALAVSLDEPDAQLKIFELDDAGLPATSYTFRGADSSEDRDRLWSVNWHPSGRILAANRGNQDVIFFELNEQANGELELRQLGQAVRAGEWLSHGEFSPDGRHYFISDTDWGPKQSDYLFNGAGSLVAIELDTLANEGGPGHRIASTAKVGRSPEGFAQSPDGTRFVTVNMHRTYLEAPGAHTSSLSLLAFDAEEGKLTVIDEHDFRGVLPEDAVFDESGEFLAVTIFHESGKHPERGFVELWTADADQLQQTGVVAEVPRGPHSLAVVAR